MERENSGIRLKELTDSFVQHAQEIIADNLAGVYLHGSAVMGCFNPAKSDIDVLVVVHEKMADETKRRFMDMLVELNAAAPQKGIEMSIVLKSVCRPFVYPTPFELHFSIMHLNWYRTNPDDYIKKMHGTDKDLAAHCTNIRRQGRCLYGVPVADMFAEVPRQNYFDSVYADIAGAEEDIIENPMYIILNLTRVLAYQRDNIILSKKEGGEWGLKNLPEEFHPLLSGALREYEGSGEGAYAQETARRYAEYMLQQIMQMKTEDICLK